MKPEAECQHLHDLLNFFVSQKKWVRAHAVNDIIEFVDACWTRFFSSWFYGSIRWNSSNGKIPLDKKDFREKQIAFR